MEVTERQKRAAYQRRYRATKKGKQQVLRANLKRMGLTFEQYDAMLAKQGGLCAACNQPETHRNQFGVCRLAIDHDHATGTIRGLLCGRCNRALGLLGDSTARLEGLLNYRRRHQ